MDIDKLKNSDSYKERLQEEVNRYKDVKNMHTANSLQQYWSRTYLKPLITSLGFKNIYSIYIYYIELISRSKKNVNIVSIGAGNCETEVLIAGFLNQKGITNYTFECLDINQAMLDRGANLAKEKGVGDRFKFTVSDLNNWNSEEKYDIIIALQCLHHFVDLELIFDKIFDLLSDSGYFLTHDMIGRNGHMRWPETLSYVEQLWNELPDSYKYNVKLLKQQSKYVNYDYSSHGFEGIRAQDILPLLTEKFHFDLFIFWGGVVDVFINKAFGPNFDANKREDIEFIDKVQLIQYKGLITGEIKPTQTISAMTKHPTKRPLHLFGKHPKDCVRHIS